MIRSQQKEEYHEMEECYIVDIYLYIVCLLACYDEASNIAALIVLACFLAASEVPNQKPL